MKYCNKRNIAPLIVVIIAMFFASCKKEHVSFYSFSERLTRNTWMPESFINENTNIDNPPPGFTYKFKEDGVFTITSLSTGLQTNNTWELFDQNKYLRIGKDIYSIEFLSNKLLCLYYGSVRISLVPVD